ncbi:DUF899 domain-containing protein [Streptomyces sp. NPDC088923]|uniref:DUF899 domain-containing protein n=1 Tax=Streptomyces sp. NPDC088923 TaxID=3365913 RepID=UPI0037FCB341
MNDTPTQPPGPLPATATPAEWLSARTALLAEEKALTRALDALAARRRALPMVAVEKEYVLTGPDGATGLLELFEGRDQLIVYHFMFAPEWETGCARCAAFLDQLGDLRHLRARGTAFAAVSRAPYPRILPFKAAGGWTVPWYSAHESDFPYDFGASLAPSGPADPSPAVLAPTDPGLSAALAAGEHADRPAINCFLRVGEQVFHTYSAYARGLDRLGSASTLLDLTALGRRDHLARPTS